MSIGEERASSGFLSLLKVLDGTDARRDVRRLLVLPVGVHGMDTEESCPPVASPAYSSRSSAETHLFFLRFKQLVALPKDRVDGLGRAGIEAEPTAFKAARRVELERRG